MVFREVAVGQITRAIRLIIQTVIGLRVVADVGAILRVDEPVRAPVVTILVEWAREDGGRLSRKSSSLSKSKFRQRSASLL